MKRCIWNNELVNNYGFLASWRRSSVGLIGSIGWRAEAEAVFARSGMVRRLGTRTQFSRNAKYGGVADEISKNNYIHNLGAYINMLQTKNNSIETIYFPRFYQWGP